MPDISGQECRLYWQSMVETMAEGLIIVDTQGVVVFINPAAERITGFRQEEVLGRPCSLFEFDTCLACVVEDGRMACRLFEDGRVVNARCTVRSKEGKAVHLLKNARVLEDAQGQVIGGVETITDISELMDKDRQISGLRRELTRACGLEPRGSATQAAPGAGEQMRAELEQALAAAGGHKAKAAAILGISRVTLWKRLKRLGLEGRG